MQKIIYGQLLLLVVLANQHCSKTAFSQMGTEASSSKITEILRDIEPVMAVRASGCITCHAQVDSGFVTDFGFGSSYFLGAGVPGLNFASGASYGDHGGSWATAKIKGPVLVPSMAPTDINGQSQTLAHYLETQESSKPVAEQAKVIEKKSIYIGAPTKAQLLSKFRANSKSQTVYFPSQASGVAFSGIQLQTSGYFKNTGMITCDGDLLVNGPLLLDAPIIRTNRGCRIYSTGSIFMQGALKYVNLANDGTNKTNLQLVSSRAILLGVGTSHCETADYPGHYYSSGGQLSNPLDLRVRSIWTVGGQWTRDMQRESRTSAAEGQIILDEAARVPGGIQDASCIAGTKRETHLERLFINAPQVHNRYRGQFKGIIVAEVALASLNAFSFAFDPIFKEVPVVPMLSPEEFLDIH